MPNERSFALIFLLLVTLADGVRLQKCKLTLTLFLCNETEDLPFVRFKTEYTVATEVCSLISAAAVSGW